MDRNLYYRPNRSFRKKSGRSAKKNLKYLYPLIFIAVVIFIIYMIISGIKGLINNQSGKLENVATAYLVTGNAQMQAFGEDDFTQVLSGQKLLEGDRIQVLDNSRVVLEFFNNSLVRLDEGSDVLITTIDNNKNEETVEVTVNAGQVWVNKGQPTKPKSVLAVRSSYMITKATGTIFSVKSGLPETVRVIDGEVFVDVIEGDDRKVNVLDSFNVGIGQEAVITNQEYDQFKRRETPSVLGPIDSDFKITQWYQWNASEDNNPTKFEVDPSLKEIEDETKIRSENPVEVLDADVEFDDLDSNKSPAPTVTSPTQGAIVTEDVVDIVGTAPENTQQIVVTSYEEGVANPYVLKGFKPGDATWRYIAAFQNGDGNLVVGENNYEIMAINEAGEESAVANLTIIFEPGETSVDAPSELTAPVITSIDGEPVGETYIMNDSRGVIQGTAGTWAEEVVVNGYSLQEYKPFSGTWSFILSTEFGTLNSGNNPISVYAVDSEGRQSPVAEIIVIYEGE